MTQAPPDEREVPCFYSGNKQGKNQERTGHFPNLYHISIADSTRRVNGILAVPGVFALGILFWTRLEKII
jgi:hypothetical protein